MTRSPATIVLPAICWLLPLVPAQTKEQAKAAVEGLVAALNAADPALLRPFLSERCSVAGLTPEQFAAVMPRVVADWKYKVASHRFELQADGQLEVKLVTADGGHLDRTMRLDAAGRFVELPLFEAEVQGAEPPLTFAGPDTVTVPLVPYGEDWSVHARIDGKEGLWVIDTGARKLLVHVGSRPDETAAPNGNTRTFGISKSVSGVVIAADVIDVDNFAIGSHVATKLQAERTDLAHLTKMDGDGKPIPLMGLIGKRELAAFETRFDFEGATLTLVKLGATGEPLVPRPAALTERHEFELRGHQALLRFAAGETKLAMVFDTGANANLMLEKYLTHPALDVQDVTTAQMKGTSADALTIRWARVAGLSIDGLSLPRMKTGFADTAPIGDADGIVGMPWIDRRSFALNYVQKCIVFGPRRDAAERR